MIKIDLNWPKMALKISPGWWGKTTPNYVPDCWKWGGSGSPTLRRWARVRPGGEEQISSWIRPHVWSSQKPLTCMSWPKCLPSSRKHSPDPPHPLLAFLGESARNLRKKKMIPLWPKNTLTSLEKKATEITKWKGKEIEESKTWRVNPPWKIPFTPAEPRRAPQNPRRAPAPGPRKGL